MLQNSTESPGSSDFNDLYAHSEEKGHQQQRTAHINLLLLFMTLNVQQHQPEPREH